MLKEKTFYITAVITCESNTRIGGSKGSLQTGGDDNPTIKNLRTLEPYLPGSSIKGRMRSGFEVRLGARDKNGTMSTGQPCGCGRQDCLICKLFGPHFNTKHNLGPSRLKVGDAQPKRGISNDAGAPMLDTKMEVVMDREKNMPMHNIGPRPSEVIVQGSKFDFEMRLEKWTGDDLKEMLEFVKKGLQQLEEDGLGAAFGRGYGRIRFSEVKVMCKNEVIEEWNWSAA